MRKPILGGIGLSMFAASAFAFSDPRVAGTWVGDSDNGTDVLILGAPQGEGGSASMQRYQGGQLVYRLDGTYRFNENPLIPSDRYQLQLQGIDNTGSHHTVSYSIQSLTDSGMTLRGVIGGHVEQLRRQK